MSTNRLAVDPDRYDMTGGGWDLEPRAGGQAALCLP